MANLFIPRKNYIAAAESSALEAVQRLNSRFRAQGISPDLSSKLAQAFDGLLIPSHSTWDRMSRDEIANYLAIERAYSTIPSKLGSPSRVVVAPNTSNFKSRADVVLKGDSSDATVLTNLLADISSQGPGEVFLLDGLVSIFNINTIVIPTAATLRGSGGATLIEVITSSGTAVQMSGTQGEISDLRITVSAGGDSLVLTNTSNLCSVRNVWISNSTAATHGVSNSGTQNIFTNVSIQGGPIIGFLENGTLSQITACQIVGNIWDFRVDSGTLGVISGCIIGNGGTERALFLNGGGHMAFTGTTFYSIGTGSVPVVEITGSATTGSSLIGNYWPVIGAVHAVQIDAGAAGHVVAYNNMKGFGAAAILDNGVGDVVTPNVT